jgi:hypothetical protein
LRSGALSDVADSAELLRRGIRGVLNRDRRFVVVGEIARPQDIAKACLELSPDIIFLGLRRDSEDYPDRSESLAALRETLRLNPKTLRISGVGGGPARPAFRRGSYGEMPRFAPDLGGCESTRHRECGDR